MARSGTRIEVHGTVQGVGFRPFVHRLASGLGLSGDVRNSAGHVVIRAAGERAAVEALLDRLVTQAPPRARISTLNATALAPDLPLDTGFRVLASEVAGSEAAGVAAGVEVPPDLAPCAACLHELLDPADRRFRYPFTNCVDCGPRVSIIEALPYDRQRTTMRDFPLCPECAREYRDARDRRFHAEPVACPRCGPELGWVGGCATEPLRGEPALRRCEEVIATGGVVAVKGVGGYQLVCDAGQDAPVARLRTAKRRPAKPFAVMVADLDTAGRVAVVSEVAAGLLADVSAPIVLLPARSDSGVRVPAVAPGLAELGIFLPSSPLHHLLLRDLARPLVVTSGNRGDEPIVLDDARAEQVLGPLVDGILRHGRRIRSRYDDSVRRVVAGGPVTIRRARGLAPTPLPLPSPAPAPILAVGAQLKHTATVAIANQAVLGPHTGDLADAETFAAFGSTIRTLTRLHGVEPATVAHDLHPGYLSTRYATRFRPERRIPVQHHHAHVAAVAAEHRLTGPFLGVAYDGLGYGGDGTLWGGEVLLADYLGYRRLARFATAPLPGGEAAVHRPARMALGYLLAAEGLDRTDKGTLQQSAGRFLARLPAREVATVRRMIERGVNCPRASSAGRLFDAVSALLGLGDDAGYEGEAAIRLEAAAARRTGTDPVRALPWQIREHAGLLVYDPVPTLRAVLTEDADPVELAARFHRTVVAVTVALVRECVARTGVHRICLGGGVFQNRLLTAALLGELGQAGTEVFTGRDVPVNDGGISYGQAAVAAARQAGGN